MRAAISLVFIVALSALASCSKEISLPSAGEPPSAAPSAAEEAAESIAEKFRTLPVKYNRPETLLLGESSPVELVIQTDKLQPVDELLKGFSGEIRTAVVRVGTQASAYLTGPEDRVKITPRGDALRTVTKDAPVTWIWDVRPLKPGDVQVVLEVFTHVKIDGDQGRVSMRVLQDTWTVHASLFEWVKYYVAEIEPVRAFLFAIAAGIVGTLGYFVFKGWKGAKPSANES
jgi:hypothetical protein